MSMIPPLVSDSPPPPPTEEDEDDEFDEFRGSNDISFGCDSLSLTPSPEPSPIKESEEVSTSSKTKNEEIEIPLECNGEISCSDLNTVILDITTNVYNTNVINNKENIPSQFIVETIKDVEKCDIEQLSNGLDDKRTLSLEDEDPGIVLDVCKSPDTIDVVTDNVEDEEDDFGAFETPSVADLTSDFANFSSFPANDFATLPDNKFPTLPDDSFPILPDDSFPTLPDDNFPTLLDDNFATLPDDALATLPDDDFGDFTSNTIQDPVTESKPILLLNEKEAFKKTEEIIKEIFLLAEDTLEDFQYFELGKGDNIFTQLQDVTDTPALGYQWSKSVSQKLLLKALNIDSRNILYGHSWNPSVPRFAANLGVQPLEPVKMEIMTPTVVESTPAVPPRSRTEAVEVPTAQFDWTNSGLVNPLDYSQTTLLDLEQLVASLDIPNTNPISQHTVSPKKEDWDIWLRYSPTRSVKSEPSPQVESDYDDFTSFQSSEPPSGWPNIPLRETYISEVPQGNINVDVVLQPTIVTPELPRKTISETLPETKTEEFDDFQMVYPVNDVEETTIENGHDDDDFTEFHSSVPAPLVASILQPTPVYNPPNSNQINWPDPGITQDELKRFEEAFSLPAPQAETKILNQPLDSERTNKQCDASILDNPRQSNIEQPRKLESKQNSLEDDEWSDFISVQKPSPVHKTKLTDRTKTSSPDLPLSVLNLGSIQPAKQPIPVITPQGLVQTKLSAKTNPVVHPKVTSIRPTYDFPSIISNQYVSQAYNFGSTLQSSQTVHNGQEDDEWGEFVSSPLPARQQNSSTTLGWDNFVPNIRASSKTMQKKSAGLVLPELDFLALKERTGVPRKK